MLNHQLPWFIGGPVLGLCVVVIRLLLGERLGVTGGYSEIVERVRGRATAFDWRSWFVVGLIVGAAIFAIAAGGPDFHGYGWMTDTFHGSSQVPIVGALLVASGVLIGFGAKAAGGCTSGNGLAGSSMLSSASLVATATFFATAIGVSFLIKAVI
jgi:uncharacterized membrane protein YedE/YeeE